MRFVRTQPAFGGGAIHRVQFGKRGHQTKNIVRIAGMNNIEIERVDRRSVQNRAHASDDDELNVVARQSAQDFQKPGRRISHVA